MISLSHEPYHLRISRLTIDKLGVKLYDKASAVVAELIANGYDADATKVDVRLPLATLLAKKGEGDVEQEYTIEVVDDGHGMTPEEAIDFYLKVGRDRRSIPGGSVSRKKKRPVMGRKGIGKLAPFGICQRIEVISAGGDETPEGYRVAHFFLEYNDIVKDEETEVPIKHGDQDGKYLPASGTTIRLSHFLPKKVPDIETFHRQLASRFIFAQPDFEITVHDTRDPVANPPQKILPVNMAIVDETKIDLSKRPVTTEDGELLPVTGWLAMAKVPYKTEELAGVRIYARNKIVAMTRDFEQPAGFTGEFAIRSYLVGEVFAEWLDLDDGDDLIRSDRQSILWDSDYGRALKAWGSSLIREIGKISMAPRRARVRDIFMTKANFEERAKARFADKEVVDAAVSIAKKIGSFAAEDELTDDVYLDGMSDFILSVAPHHALIEAFQRFSQEVAGGAEVTLENLMDLFGKTRVAEMASYGQIAAERVRAIRELESVIQTDADEDKLQELIAKAPWLIEPTWTVMTKNQSLKTVKVALEKYYKEKTGEELTLAIGLEKKRPDFTLVSLGHKLHIVEIKKPHKAFDDPDAERLINYVAVFDAFFDDNPKFKSEFPDGYEITLIVDSMNGVKKPAHSQSILRAKERKTLTVMSWTEFLNQAVNSHEQFLEIHDKAQERSK